MRPAILILPAVIFLAACAPQATPSPFRPPTQIAPTVLPPTLTPLPAIYAPPPTATFTSTPEGPCSNDLKFLEDLTIPDGTLVNAGASIDKQWLIQNSGTCDWDSTYHLQWIGGDPLGAEQEQPLYPARAETQATLRIIFTAPNFAGAFESSWQAVSPDGIFFGDPVYITITVQ